MKIKNFKSQDQNAEIRITKADNQKTVIRDALINHARKIERKKVFVLEEDGFCGRQI